MPVTLPLEVTAPTGHTLIRPATASPTADPTRRPGQSNTNIIMYGPHSISPVQPTMVRSSRSSNPAARPLGPSSTRRDLTIRYLPPSAQGSLLTTGSVTVTYVSFFFHSELILKGFSTEISFPSQLGVAFAREKSGGGKLGSIIDFH